MKIISLVVMLGLVVPVHADDSQQWFQQENARISAQNDDHEISQKIDQIETDRQEQKQYPDSNIYTNQKTDQDVQDLRWKQDEIQRQHEIQ